MLTCVYNYMWQRPIFPEYRIHGAGATMGLRWPRPSDHLAVRPSIRPSGRPSDCSTNRPSGEAGEAASKRTGVRKPWSLKPRRGRPPRKGRLGRPPGKGRRVRPLRKGRRGRPLRNGRPGRPHGGGSANDPVVQNRISSFDD